jgi:hypothetical protein
MNLFYIIVLIINIYNVIGMKVFEKEDLKIRLANAFKN